MSKKRGRKRQALYNIPTHFYVAKAPFKWYNNPHRKEVGIMKKVYFSIVVCLVAALFCFASFCYAEYLGKWSSNRYGSDSTSNPYSSGGSRYSPNSVNNPYGQYGSRYSPKSATNPYATNAPKLYDNQGNYRGKLSNNPYDPDSVSNPYGRYGSRYSSDSVNNPYGAGSKYKSDSPNNPYGAGWTIIGE